MSRTVCVYHSIDLDGWMSAAIVKHWFTTKERNKEELARTGTSGLSIDTIEFIGYNYGQPIPDLSAYDKVIMCDISFPKDIMLKLAVEKDFTWIDHHISAIKDNDELIDAGSLIHPHGKLDTTYAACELTWQYFFPNDDMPEIVRMLGRYDCFGHKGTDEEQDVLEFQYGARNVITCYEDAYKYLLESFKGVIRYDYTGDYTTEDIIHGNGVIIYSYLCMEAMNTYRNGFEVQFKTMIYDDNKEPAHKRTLKFICINKERFNPINFGIDYHKDGYDGVACFYFDGSVYNFSLYNDNGNVDCSLIAEQFGGGGHKGASGFRIKNLNEIIK